MAKVPVLRSGWKIDPAELAVAQQRTEARLTDLFTHQPAPAGRRAGPHPPIVVDGVQLIDDAEAPPGLLDDTPTVGIDLPAEPSGVAGDSPVTNVIGVVDAPGTELVGVVPPAPSTGELVGVMEWPRKAADVPLRLPFMDGPLDAPAIAAPPAPWSFREEVTPPAPLAATPVAPDPAPEGETRAGDMPAVGLPTEIEPSADELIAGVPAAEIEMPGSEILTADAGAAATSVVETVDGATAAASTPRGNLPAAPRSGGAPRLHPRRASKATSTTTRPGASRPQATGASAVRPKETASHPAATALHAAEPAPHPAATAPPPAAPHAAEPAPPPAATAVHAAEPAQPSAAPHAAEPAPHPAVTASRTSHPAARHASARPSPAALPAPAVVVAAVCPYCAMVLQPAPTSSRRCSRCHQPIVVKRIDGLTAYLTEGAVAIFEAERRKEAEAERLGRERERWLKLAVGAGVPAHKASRLAATPLSQEVVDDARQLYLETVDRAFQVAKRDRRYEEASRIRRDQAIALHRLAGSPQPPPDDLVAIYREGVAAELRGLAEIVRDAELVGATCCDACRTANGRIVAIAKELAAPQLPHQGCPKVFCRCSWDLATRDRELVLRYLRRRHRPTASTAARPAARPAARG